MPAMKNALLPSCSNRQAGFTLAEIAIVLIIVTLLTGAAFSMMTSLTSQSRLGAARDGEKALKASLKAFISRTGRLPCPAVGAQDSANPNFGLEAAPTTGSYGANACPGTNAIGDCTAPEECLQTRSFRGIVPWRTLGIAQDAAVDPWLRFYTYQVSVSGIVNPFDAGKVVSIQTTQAMVGNIEVLGADGSFENRNAVAVLISHGADGLGGFVPGSQMPMPPAGSTQLENADSNRRVINAGASNNEANPYDDVLAYFDVSTILDGIAFPTPGLESMTGRVKYLVEMIAIDSGKNPVPPCPPSSPPGPCIYSVKSGPGALGSVGVPAPYRRTSTGAEIAFAPDSLTTPTDLAFTFDGSTQTVTSQEFWSTGVRLGVFR